MIYDIEIFKNCFLVIFYIEEKDNYYVFEISPFKDERKDIF